MPSTSKPSFFSINMRLIVIATLLLLALITIEACCKNKSVGKCCGEGPCNVFCCNCDGGCNSSCETEWDSYLAAAGTAAGFASLMGRKKRNVVDEQRVTALERFSSIDSNGDGAISEGEGLAYLMSSSSARVKKDVQHGEWFAKIDTDGDGVIQPGEFDRRLA